MSGATLPVPMQGNATASRPKVRVRRGQMRDTPKLVRLYLDLSPAARHAFHPFPFNRVALWLLYPGLLAYQRVADRWMRRFAPLIAVLVVAEVEGIDGIAGYGTIRGTVIPDGRRCVRYGSVVREGVRGVGVGYALLIGLGEEALALGVGTAVGSVFESDTRTVQLVRRFGFKTYESDWIDPGAPHEKNYRLEADLTKILRTPNAGGGTPTQVTPEISVVPENG